MARRLVLMFLSLLVASSLRLGPARGDGAPPHTWAGVYEQPSPFGADPLIRLEIGPGGRYSLERLVGCLLSPESTSGVVIVEDGRLRLQPPPPPAFERPGPLEGPLLPFTLDGRRYLVGAEGVRAFCNAVNGGFDPATRGGALSRLDEPWPSAPPDLAPAPEVGGCLLGQPLRPQIVSVGEVRGYGPGEISPGSKRRLRVGQGPLPVVLDVGARDGVFVGMEFHAVCPACAYQPATVTEVGESTSEAVFEASWLMATPEPGWRLSTRAGDPLD